MYSFYKSNIINYYRILLKIKKEAIISLLLLVFKKVYYHFLLIQVNYFKAIILFFINLT